MAKTKLFSVTIADCEVHTFACGGHGGAGKDTSNNGVRIVHPPSGAAGKSCDERSQLANKRLAFRRMAESAEFTRWVHREAFEEAKKQERIKFEVEQMLTPDKLRVEVMGPHGKWIVIDPSAPFVPQYPHELSKYHAEFCPQYEKKSAPCRCQGAIARGFGADDYGCWDTRGYE